MAEFVNINGEASAVTMKSVVLGLRPGVELEHRTTNDKDTGEPREWFAVKDAPEWAGQEIGWRLTIGSGATEEAAWRAAHHYLKAEPDDAGVQETSGGSSNG